MLSVIIPIRNRGGTRLQNCLRSLRWQDHGGPLEIVLSDFGSDPAHANALRAVAEEFDARVVHTATTDLWNRSVALNIGIRAASGDRVLCTDADMLFADNFVSTVIRHLENRQPTLVLCQCRDLPESIPEEAHDKTRFPALLSASKTRRAGSIKRPHSMSTGACQAAPRAFFEQIRGYDERYVYWGCEDGDLVSRATRAGLRLAWIENETSMLHQWHPTLKRARRWLYYKNKLRFQLTRNRVIKNPEGWGLVSG